MKEEEPEILAVDEGNAKEEKEEESEEDTTIPEPELVEALGDVEAEVEADSEANVEPETEQNSEPELVEAMQEVVPESKPEPERIPEPTKPEPEFASNLSDAAKYFLSSSGLRKNISETEAKLAASIVKEREDAARRELESRIERLGIGADDEEEDA